jgi:hypothetical protein
MLKESVIQTKINVTVESDVLQYNLNTPKFLYLLKCSAHLLFTELQGGSNMTGTNCDLFTHK